MSAARSSAMRYRKHFVLFVCPLVMVALAGWQWPVNPERVERQFGAALGPAGLERGLVLAAGGESIRAVADGKVLFRDSGVDATAAGAPMPVAPGMPRRGGVVVLEHENGFRSIYSGLRPEGPSIGQRVLQGRSVGIGGEHGVRFELFDTREGWYVNPFAILEVPPDTAAPEIDGIALVSEVNDVSAGEANNAGEGPEAGDDHRDGPVRTQLPSYNRARHPAGEAEVRLLIGFGEIGEIASLQRAALTRGGETIHEILFDRLEVDGGDRLLWESGARDAGSLYADNGWLRLGPVTIPPGESRSFTARITDYHGNERTRVFTIDGDAVDPGE